MNYSDKLIKHLNMKPHREGGHFVESFRDKENNVSLIYYLLRKGEKSHWHKLTKNEILHYYDGDPLELYISTNKKKTEVYALGKNIENNEKLHIVVPLGSWFSMESKGNFSLIGCTVSPGFNYNDFELAPPDWKPAT